MEYFPLILVGGFPDAFPDVTDDQSGRSGGHGFFSPPPQLCKKIRVATAAGLVVGDIRKCIWKSPKLKSMGNIPFGRFSVTKPQTPNPVILHQFVAA